MIFGQKEINYGTKLCDFWGQENLILGENKTKLGINLGDFLGQES